MKPLLLVFKETPKADEKVDFTELRYDENLNLSVNILTGCPAINEIVLGTETFTRQGEGTDSDLNSFNIGMLMATETFTKSGEGIDSDPFRFRTLMETATSTFVSTESTDSDK